MNYKEIDVYKAFPLGVGVKDSKEVNYVKRLQKALDVKTDGYFGANTEKVLYAKTNKKFLANISELERLEAISETNKLYENKLKSKELKYLIIHCTATPEGREVTKSDLELWHLGLRRLNNGKCIYKGVVYDDVSMLPKETIAGLPISRTNGRGWKKLGYADLITIDGTIINVTPYNDDNFVDSWEITNGAKGLNSVSRHVVYAGGLDATYKDIKDTRTDAQKKALEFYVKDSIKNNPKIKIAGHCELPNVAKACPSFSVSDWLKEMGIKESNIYLK